MEIRVDIWNKLKLQRGLRGARLRLLRPTPRPAPDRVRAQAWFPGRRL